MEKENLRKRIDEIDEQFIQLLEERLDIARAIGEEKKGQGLPILDMAREREILNRVAERAGDKNETYAKLVFSAILAASKNAQTHVYYKNEEKWEEKIAAAKKDAFPSRADVACQGTEGAYSQQACDKLFPMARILYSSTFEGVFKAVETGLCKYGILPIENSLAGSVSTVYDLMKKHKFYVVRSVRLKIDHALLLPKGAKFSDIREVVSHEQAISQCSEFLQQHGEWKVTRFENTAAAARFVAQSGRKDIAAIASRRCAALYDLHIERENVQNQSDNFTRFLCIAKDMEIYPGANKISLMLTLPNLPGALFQLMAKISAMGMNVTKLESRPIPGRDFEFLFYFDIDADITAPGMAAFLEEITRELETCQMLGAYAEMP